MVGHSENIDKGVWFVAADVAVALEPDIFGEVWIKAPAVVG